MKFMNLTPHTLTIEGVGNLPPSGITARVTHERTPCTPIKTDTGSVRIIQQDYGPVQNIPDPQEGTVYIVSAVVVSAILAGDDQEMRNRLGRDVFAPDTGPDAVRSHGQVTMVRGLVY